jgi:hypothetical protein
MAEGSAGRWPALRVADWQRTRDTLHLRVQIVGKVRLALAPEVDHWWHVPLYVNSAGLPTSLMPHGSGGVEICFDFTAHQLAVRTTSGLRHCIALAPRSIAGFYAELRACLSQLGVDVPIRVMPSEIPGAIPFPDDGVHRDYDARAVHQFWISLVHAHRVLSRLRAGLRGQASPGHFFWGGFDLAVTRFSGRPAPPHPGGIPHTSDQVMREAYSDEVAGSGYWPGGAAEGAFYAYAYPSLPGSPSGRWRRLRPGRHRRVPAAYTAVRTARDPDAYLLDFLNSTFAAASELNGWEPRPTHRGAGLTPRGSLRES